MSKRGEILLTWAIMVLAMWGGICLVCQIMSLLFRWVGCA